MNKKAPYVPADANTTQTIQPASIPENTSITSAQVTQHNSRSSCWSIIDGNVYDLTSWIPNHPGGEQAILSICGIDGAQRYNAKHGGNSKITKILGGFKIGTFAN
jgi:cytochrome b involved in lipid metabolism